MLPERPESEVAIGVEFEGSGLLRPQDSVVANHAVRERAVISENQLAEQLMGIRAVLGPRPDQLTIDASATARAASRGPTRTSTPYASARSARGQGT